LENSVLYRVAPMRSPLQQPSPNANQQQSLTSQHPPATSNRTQSNAQRVAT
uniref:Ataxin 2 n=1 Tax=Anisakis simplex TaxID=6269 RepID=A0A0M3JIU0_ANISI